MALIVPFLKFLLEHADLLNEMWQAINGGLSKEDLLKAIKEAQIKAADAVVDEALGKS
jgi:hypothetical protein